MTVDANKRPSRSSMTPDDSLRIVMDALPDCHVFIKDRECRFVLANACHLSSLGAASLEAIIGKTDFDFLPRETAQRRYDDEQEVIRTGTAATERDERMLDTRQREHTLVTTRTPLLDKDGRVTGIVGISRDITAHKQREQDRDHQRLAMEDLMASRSKELALLNRQLQDEVAEHQRAKHSLETEKNRLMAIMDNLPDCHLFIKDRDSRFVMTNAFLMQKLGVKNARDVIGKTDFDFFPRDLAEQYFASEQQIMQSGKPILAHEEPCVGLNGKNDWLLTTKIPLRDAEGKVTGLVGISLDITRLKTASNQLAEERNLLRTLVDALPSWTYVKDLSSRFTLVNQTLARKTGFGTPDNLIGKSDFDLVPREIAERYFTEEQALMRNDGPTLRRIDYFVDAEGNDTILEVRKQALRDSKGTVIGLLGVNTEITELRRSEAALQGFRRRVEEDRNLLRALIDNIPHCVYAKDILGRFIVANTYVAQIMKAKSPEDLIGKTDFDFYPESQARAYRADEETVLATGHTLTNKPEPHILESGETRWLLSTKLPLKGRDGAVVGIVGVSIDDTERREAEERRLHVEEQLRHTEKLKAIGQLAGGIAHDFNNQLAAIMGSADMIRTWPDEDDVAQHAEAILTASKRAADLTGKLLAFARKGRYQSTPVDMHKIIGEVVSLLSRSIDKRIHIETHCDATASVVCGDPTQLQNALLNMAINARDAMRHMGGDLTFTTETVTLNEEQCRNSPHEISPGPHILINVSDTGTGMDTETQKHIFEPFFTTKCEGEGTGMGLAAVYGTVRNHHGAIDFSSKLGQGTRFSIWLPLSTEPLPSEKDTRSAPPVEGQARLLVVDDEETVRGTLRTVLERLGYKITLCNDGLAAVDFYKNAWREIDLVLIDMVMPHMGGLDAFLAMHAINPSVRALLLSGYSMGGDVQKILDAGVKGFIQKPFNIAEISQAIAKTLNH